MTERSTRSFIDLSADSESPKTEKDRHWFDIWKNNLRFSYLNQSDSLLASLVSYGKVRFDPPTSPAVLMGRAYVDPFSHSPLPETQTFRGTLRELRDEFETQFQQIIWCTYRSGFTAIRRIEDGELKGEFTSDVGWGCTLRVAQMLIANTYQRLSSQRSTSCRLILESPDSPFSIHSLVQAGEKHLNRRAGDWYAPSTACHALKSIVDEHREIGLAMVVAMDGCVYFDQVYAAASGKDIREFRLNCRCEKKVKTVEPALVSDDYELFDSEDQECTTCYMPIRADQWCHPLLLTVPLMLGLGQVHHDYYESIKFFLRMPQTIGVIGGRPKSALYFVGYQQDSLVFLDPHYVQKTVTDPSHNSFRCENANLLRLCDAESSMSVAFYIGDLATFEEFCTALTAAAEVTKRVVTVQPRTPGYQLGEDLPTLHMDADFIVIDR